MESLLDFAPRSPSCDSPRKGTGAVRPVALNDFQKHGKLSRPFLSLPFPLGPPFVSLHCAHRMNTVLPCAFCAQESYMGTPPPPSLN
jgi:hypothetical protein